MNWRMFSRCGHFVSQILHLHVCEAQTSTPHHHPYPELGFQRPWGLVWLQTLEGSWRLCGALRTSGITGTFGTRGLYGVLGFFALDGILFFYWQFYINTYKKILGR